MNQPQKISLDVLKKKSIEELKVIKCDVWDDLHRYNQHVILAEEGLKVLNEIIAYKQREEDEKNKKELVEDKDGNNKQNEGGK
jgi:hypothetical protein